MNITDELRDFARRWPCTDYICKDMLAIADRIDEEHETRVAALQEKVRNQRDALTDARLALEARNKGELKSSWQRELDALNGELADLRSRTVELPLDADGEYIRVGERVQLIGNDPSTVSHMSLADDGWRVYVKYDGAIGTGSGEPKHIRHYHATTTEDVLREMLEQAFPNNFLHKGEAIEAMVAVYAKRLQLADGS